MKNRRLFLLPAMFFVTTVSAQNSIPVPFSSLQRLQGSGWQSLTFPNIARHSHYQLVDIDGLHRVRATSSDSASGLIFRVHVDPSQYPVIRWRWKISGVYSKGDARKKAGDDYPARIYVAFAFEPQRASWWEKLRRKAAQIFYRGPLPGSALNYIWANRLPPGKIIANAFSPQTMMIPVETGNRHRGQWRTEQRNIVADYRKAFGHSPPPIVGIGIMTDSDNTGESATAWYGDIELTRAPGKR